MDVNKSNLYSNEDQFDNIDSISKFKKDPIKVCLTDNCLLPLNENIKQNNTQQNENIYSKEDKAEDECDNEVLRKDNNSNENSAFLNRVSIKADDTLETNVHTNSILNEEDTNSLSSINLDLPNEQDFQELSSNNSSYINHLHRNLDKTSETDTVISNASEVNMYDIKLETSTTKQSLIVSISPNSSIEKDLDLKSLQNNNDDDDDDSTKVVEMNATSTEETSKDMECINKVNVLSNLSESMDKEFKQEIKLQPSEISVQKGKVDGTSVYRPTLNDDSRLVRIPLPTNPMSLIQSNAHFINRSRNFLNFITEKSTNIMEKALLPQHLTMKYTSGYMSSNEKKNINGASSKTELSPKYLMPPTKCDTTTNIANPSVESAIEQAKKDEQKDVLNENNSKHQVSSMLNSPSVDLINDTSTNITNNCKLNNFEKHITTQAEEALTTTDGVILQENLAGCQNHSVNDESSYETNLLQHPSYLTLLKDYAKLKANNIKLSERVEALEARNATLEAEKNGELYKIQIETLEKTVDRLTFELRSSLATQDILKREHSAANKEMESMVIKYAVSEKQFIDTQRAREYAERKLKDVTKEQELLQNKLRQLQGEKTRICNILDGKCREITELQKEVERLNGDVQMKEVKLKWSQNKLKTEMESQKETQQKLDKALSRINEMKEECEQVRKDTQQTIRKFQLSEENKAITLDQQLKEQQARLILERYVTEDKEMLCLQLQKEVETLLNRQQLLIEENNALTIKIQNYEIRQQEYEDTLNNLKILAEQRQTEIIDLSQKVSQIEVLKSQLQEAEKSLTSTSDELEKLHLTNQELGSDIHACRLREAAMLDFTQKLTDKNVCLQSEFTALETKTKQLEEEQGPLRDQVNELKKKIKLLEDNLTSEQKRRIEECEILAKHVAEQTQLVQSLTQKLEDSQGENEVLKRKQQRNMKEITRELQQCRKKLEAFQLSSSNNSLIVASRAGSNTSLNTGETPNGTLSDNNTNGENYIHSNEPSTKLLMDRIVSLQNDNVKKLEKIEFLEGHAQTLVEEIQKKTKIIQHYILQENSGAMGSNERDKHKLIKSRKNTAELARYGGIMASVYNQRVSDDNMSLELSLEINQKLQAVVEDILLKNMTLRDSVDILGAEIAKLTKQNQQRQLMS
ncbi:coiled-coil domain-containing protein 186 isoform X1 [Polistes fuscatus]|uniref:coiled-coil domain-containing protein 186 isoform X1 n=1 Tax=Polistes fuscatus TaxID=30207 RepID=UPI001CAA068D|nr:coiled-coil domain-containing protein 186 isoform X1 [Polistes fuscatus]